MSTSIGPVAAHVRMLLVQRLRSSEILEWLLRAHQERTGVPLATEVLGTLLDQAESWLEGSVDGFASAL